MKPAVLIHFLLTNSLENYSSNMNELQFDTAWFTVHMDSTMRLWKKIYSLLYAIKIRVGVENQYYEHPATVFEDAQYIGYSAQPLQYFSEPLQSTVL